MQKNKKSPNHLIRLSDFLILKWEKRGIEKVNML